MKLIKKILFGLLIALVIMQFFRPEKNQGNLESITYFYNETKPPEEVKVILKQACFDCHSDVTKYPWYNAITPVNYWLEDHIKDGKKHFNVSNWKDASIKRRDHKFEELIEMVEEKSMPLNSYTWIHKEAKLTDKQISTVIDWAKQVKGVYSKELEP